MMQFGDQPDIEDNLPKPEDQQQPPQPQYQQPPEPVMPPGFDTREAYNSPNDAGPAHIGIQAAPVQNYSPAQGPSPIEPQSQFLPSQNPLTNPGVYDPTKDIYTNANQSAASAFTPSPMAANLPAYQWGQQNPIDSLNRAQGIVQQGLQTITSMFGPQAQAQADQNSINQAQSLVGGALQGIQTVGNAVDQDQASANQRLAQVTGGMGQDPLSRGLAQVGPGMNWAQNNIINNIPVPGMAGEGLNLASAGLNALGVNAPNLGSVGGVMQTANIPAEQLPNIPGFSSQPQIAQQFEQGAVGAAPYVLGGPESAVGKGLSILGGGLGFVADQNLGTQLGPIGAFQLLGMGAGGLADRGIRNADPLAGVINPPPSVPNAGVPIPESFPLYRGEAPFDRRANSATDITDQMGRSFTEDPARAQIYAAKQGGTVREVAVPNEGFFGSGWDYRPGTDRYMAPDEYRQQPTPPNTTTAPTSTTRTGLSPEEQLAFGSSGGTAESTGMRYAGQPQAPQLGLDPLTSRMVNDLEVQKDSLLAQRAQYPGFEGARGPQDYPPAPPITSNTEEGWAARTAWNNALNAQKSIEDIDMRMADLAKGQNPMATLTGDQSYRAQPGTTTTAPTSTTTTSGAYPGRSPDELDAVDAANALRAAGVYPQEQLIGVTPNGTRFEVPPSLMGHVDVMSGEVRDSRLGTGTPMSVFQRIERPDGTVLWDRGGQQSTPVTNGPYPPRDQFASGGNYWDTTGIGPKIEAEQQRGPYIQWINENIHPNEQRVYKAALADVLAGKQAQAPTPEGTLGPDPQTNPYRIAHDSIRQNLAPDMPYLAAPPPGSGATETPFRAYPGAPREAVPAGEPTPGGFRPPEQGVIAEGVDGTIHNITGFLGARGDGEQFFQTEDGVVPLSQLTNLSAADRAELGQMRTAAGGMPPNTPNAAPPSGLNSPGAAAFQQSPAGQQFVGQRAAGMNVTQPGVSSSNAAPSTTYGGGAGGITGQALPAGRLPSSGGQGGGRSGPPPTLAGKIDWDPFHNLMSAIGAPTQPLLTGLHLARFAPQEALRPSVLGNGLRAMGEAALKGNADAVSAHINNDFGPNVPAGVRPEAMKQWSGNPSTNPTAVQKFINSLPVVGPVLNRFREVNSALLGNLRDAHYLTAADRLARTDPNASLDMYNDLWREANNATGHSTIPGLSGNSVIGNMGLGPSAMAARVQELGNTVIGSGAPVPFAAAGSRAEAFKTLMGVAGTMAGATALASALGANVNTTNPFTAFGVDSTFLKPVTTNGVFKTAYGTGGAGYDTVIKAAANIGNDLFNGDEKAALDHALAFSRGEFGVVPSGVIDSILGTTWDGRPYSWNDFLNEAKTGFMADQNGNLGQGRSVPIPAQDIGEAVKAYGPEGLLRAAPSLLASSVQTSPINTTSQAFKYATTPDTLTRAFQGEDKPLATILQGKDWNDLMSTEKSALTKTLDPQVLQQIHDESYQRNPETTKHSDTVQYISDKKTATENATLDRYNRKEITADEAASQMKAAQKEYFAVKNQLDSMPGYLAEQKKFDKSNESGAQIVLDGFFQIPDKAGREAYVAAVMQHDPELGARLLLATQPRNQSKLEELYYSGQLK